jgi:hypothetical protein
MPLVGERKSLKNMGKAYANSPLNAYVASFKKVADNILTEGVDLFANPATAVMRTDTNESLKSFFIENSCDRASMTEEQFNEHMEMMEAQYDNDREAMLEYAPIGSFNPVIGISMPMHKNILMNNSFDKVLPKFVSQSPKFTLTMETRQLVTPEGKVIDMFTQQNEMTPAILAVAPIIEVPLVLPEVEQTDILKDYFLTNKVDDNLSIETHISAVLLETYAKTGDEVYTISGKTITKETAAADGIALKWFKVKKEFTPSYSSFGRTMVEPVTVTVDTAAGTKVVTDTISAYMKDNMFMIQVSSQNVKAVKVAARIDTSTAMLRTCSVKWGEKTDIVEIPNAIPFNTTISPEEVKDIAALYQVNQLTKVMTMIKDVMGNMKDDMIKTELDNSFLNLPATSKFAETFDFAPRDGYLLDHIEWRSKTFMDALDTYVTTLIQVLNDPNVTISITGRAELIKKILPQEFDFKTPDTIGAIEMEYQKVVVTGHKRVYEFMSADKMRGNNNLIVTLKPRNSERIIYMVVDYQMYLSNEIRNAANPALPAVHAFERWKFKEYQGVQGRLKVLNPTGLRTRVENTDPIGTTAMNDFEANKPE